MPRVISPMITDSYLKINIPEIPFSAPLPSSSKQLYKLDKIANAKSVNSDIFKFYLWFITIVDELCPPACSVANLKHKLPIEQDI